MTEPVTFLRLDGTLDEPARKDHKHDIQQPEMGFPTFVGNWENYDLTDFMDVRFYKLPTGIVHIEGAMKNGFTATNSLIFTLPEGYRPSDKVYFVVAINAAVAYGVIYVEKDGSVRVGYLASNNFVSLNGIIFYAG